VVLVDPAVVVVVDPPVVVVVDPPAGAEVVVVVADFGVTLSRSITKTSASFGRMSP
jgi:hypothetical protein